MVHTCTVYCKPVSFSCVALRTQITVVGVVVSCRLRVPSAFGHLCQLRGANVCWGISLLYMYQNKAGFLRVIVPLLKIRIMSRKLFEYYACFIILPPLN